jgi:hypothetical protein
MTPQDDEQLLDVGTVHWRGGRPGRRCKLRLVPRCIVVRIVAVCLLLS